LNPSFYTLCPSSPRRDPQLSLFDHIFDSDVLFGPTHTQIFDSYCSLGRWQA
jgi:hypothetical protein